jgi:hypothetical protein
VELAKVLSASTNYLLRDERYPGPAGPAGRGGGGRGGRVVSDLHPRYSTTLRRSTTSFGPCSPSRWTTLPRSRAWRKRPAASPQARASTRGPDHALSSARWRRLRSRARESRRRPDEALTETEALVALLDMATRTAYACSRLKDSAPVAA